MSPKSNLDMLRCYIQWWAPINCLGDDKSVALRNQVYEKFCRDAKRDDLQTLSPSLFGRLLRQALPKLQVKRLLDKKALVYGYASIKLTDEETPPPPKDLYKTSISSSNRDSAEDKKRKRHSALLQSSPSKINLQRTGHSNDSLQQTFKGGSLVMLQSLCNLDFNLPMLLGATPRVNYKAEKPKEVAFDSLSKPAQLGWGDKVAPNYNALKHNAHKSLVAPSNFSQSALNITALTDNAQQRFLPPTLAQASHMNSSKHITYFLNYIASDSMDLFALKWLPLSLKLSSDESKLVDDYKTLLQVVVRVLINETPPKYSKEPTLRSKSTVDLHEQPWKNQIKQQFASFYASPKFAKQPALSPSCQRTLLHCDKTFLEMIALVCIRGRRIFTAPQCMQIVRELGDNFNSWANFAVISNFIATKKQLVDIFIRCTHQHLRLEALQRQVAPIFDAAANPLDQIAKFWARFQSQEACNLFYKEMSWFGGVVNTPCSSRTAKSCSQATVQAVLQWFAELLCSSSSIALFFDGVNKLLVFLAERHLKWVSESLADETAWLTWQHEMCSNWTIASQVVLRNAAASDVLEPAQVAWMTKLGSMVVDFVIFKIKTFSLCSNAKASVSPPLLSAFNLPLLSFEQPDAFSASDLADSARQKQALLMCFGVSALSYASASAKAQAKSSSTGHCYDDSAFAKSDNWSVSQWTNTGARPLDTANKVDFGQSPPKALEKVDSLWLDPELATSMIDSAKLDCLNLLGSEMDQIHLANLPLSPVSEGRDSKFGGLDFAPASIMSPKTKQPPAKRPRKRTLKKPTSGTCWQTQPDSILRLAGFPENHTPLLEFFTQQYLTPSQASDKQLSQAALHDVEPSVQTAISSEKPDFNSLLSDSECLSMLNTFQDASGF